MSDSLSKFWSSSSLSAASASSAASSIAASSLARSSRSWTSWSVSGFVSDVALVLLAFAVDRAVVVDALWLMSGIFSSMVVSLLESLDLAAAGFMWDAMLYPTMLEDFCSFF